MTTCLCEGCKRRLLDMEYGFVKIICYRCKFLNIFEIVKQTGADQQTFINLDEKTVSDIILPG